MSFRILVTGNYACFPRPELSVERYSYDVITPSAAAGLIGAIYCKPAIRWVIDRIHVLNPIQMVSVRRNELANATPYGIDQVSITKERMQRTSVMLHDVAYVIEFHGEETGRDSDEDYSQGINVLAKHQDRLRHRLERGQCFLQPCLGHRELPADVRLIDQIPASVHKAERDLGLMLHTMDRQTRERYFWRAIMRDGCIEVPPLNSSGVLKGGPVQ